jgi:hypothetical protein
VLVNELRGMTAARARRLLDLENEATPAEVRQAYRDLVRVWHPDRFDSDERLKLKAAGRMSEINVAYRFLVTTGLRPPTAAVDRRRQTRQPAWGVWSPATSAGTVKPNRVGWRGRVGRTLGQLGIAAVVVASVAVIARPNHAMQPMPQPSLQSSESSRPASSVPTTTMPASPRMVVESTELPSRSPFSRDLDRVLASAQAASRPAARR